MSSALSLVLFVASPCRSAMRLAARRSRCHYSSAPRAEALPPKPLSLFYNDHYQYPLPEGHRFPMGKYRQVRRRLQQTLTAASLATFSESPLCSLEDIATTRSAGAVTGRGRFRTRGNEGAVNGRKRSQRAAGAFAPNAPCRRPSYSGRAPPARRD